MRCFVAVWPAPDVADAIASLPRPAIDGLRWSTREQWHVTLRFFGEIDRQSVHAATKALSKVADEVDGPVTATGGPSTRLLGPALVIWPVDGLAGTAKAVQQATDAIGQPLSERKFLGHITLARGRRGTDLRPGARLLAPLERTWPVTSLTLVQSELRPEGARYRVVERFLLAQATRH
ncbi:MAG: 2'-5' RNA ligase family protein [Acidimicrobiales bacterium]